jgi:hypothetical protein
LPVWGVFDSQDEAHIAKWQGCYIAKGRTFLVVLGWRIELHVDDIEQLGTPAQKGNRCRWIGSSFFFLRVTEKVVCCGEWTYSFASRHLGELLLAAGIGETVTTAESLGWK